MDPCIDYCYNRFGKEYTEDCDNNCEYAKAIAENKKLQEILKELKCDNINLTGELAKIFDNMTVAIKTLRGPTREMVEKMRGEWKDLRESYNDVPKRQCSHCGIVLIGLDTPFCEACGRPMTDKAVEIRLKELEALHEVAE